MATITATLNSTLNGHISPRDSQISRIQAFIISRIGQLKEYGWTTKMIAEALGVDEAFIETAVNMYSK